MAALAPITCPLTPNTERWFRLEVVGASRARIVQILDLRNAMLPER
jgi:hypothetical protein